MQLNSITTWNTAENRARLLEAAKAVRNAEVERGRAAQDFTIVQNATQVYYDEYQAIELMALPELELLDWDESIKLFGSMWPDSGIYMLPHKHRHKVCGCVRRCLWPDREEPCQAIEHWDRKCDKHWGMGN